MDLLFLYYQQIIIYLLRHSMPFYVISHFFWIMKQFCSPPIRSKYSSIPEFFFSFLTICRQNCPCPSADFRIHSDIPKMFQGKAFCLSEAAKKSCFPLLSTLDPSFKNLAKIKIFPQFDQISYLKKSSDYIISHRSLSIYNFLLLQFPFLSFIIIFHIF